MNIVDVASTLRPETAIAGKTRVNGGGCRRGLVKNMESRREQLRIDPEKCTGCRRCQIACAMKHHGRIDPGLARIRILRFDSPALNVPIVCLACDRAPCIKVCPMNARVRERNGTVVTNPEACIGCRACVYICPVGSPAVNPYTDQTLTCDMCQGDVDGPWCVAACKHEGALTLDPLESLTRRTVRERAGRSKPVRPA